MTGRRRAQAWFLGVATLLCVGATSRDGGATPPRGRVCGMTGTIFTSARVYGVPVRGLEVPLGIGGCYDGARAGFEWYGTASLGYAWTGEGRGAVPWSIFGAKFIGRVEMIRVLGALGVTAWSFDPAPGQIVGKGSSETVGFWELGVGVDLVRAFDHEESPNVRETIAVDVAMRGDTMASGLTLAIGVVAHL